ncbi:MAG TPA: hypothetical protein VG406_21900 [Isosphaeraceae bacterium]|jgi:hypothetical protein|nr:hypothetical protein [Isosphaeraceae bacterium]
MLATSWPLWVESPDFPRVPFVAGLPDPSRSASWVAFGLLVAAVAGGVAWRPALASGAVVLAALVAQDQHRLQPWAYQYFLVSIALAACPAGEASGLSRLFVVALYVHSGLSKLDASFVHGLGAEFLAVATRPFGLHPRAWPDWVRTAATLAMPAAESGIGVGLCSRRTRRPALVGAIGMHLALLFVLGPAGLDHSANVLIWNGALIVEDVILFGPTPAPSPTSGRFRASGLARLAMMGAAILPFGERLGLWDAWPSFALYASHVDLSDVYINEDEAGSLPESLRRQLAADGAWRRLDLTAWSRSVRGVPVYPQARACNGLAEALAARYRGARALRVVRWGRAGWLSGRRDRDEAIGLDAIRRLGDRDRLNAHPAGAFLRRP